MAIAELTPEQHAERSTGIGSSDAGAVLGVNPYRTKIDVYMEKTEQAEAPDLSDNEAVHWGNVLEQTVADEFDRRTGNTVANYQKTYRHSKMPWIVAHPDRIEVGKKRFLLECKTGSAHVKDRWGQQHTAEVPDEYLVQVHHQMIATGIYFAYIAVLLGGNDFRIYDIPYDPELGKIIIDFERAFWKKNVKKRIPPEVQLPSDLNTLYPDDSGETMKATPKAEEAYHQLVSIKAELDNLTAKKDHYENIIKEEMADASKVVGPDGEPLVTWRKSKGSKKLNTAKLKQDHPELFEKYTVPTAGSRKFTVK